MKHIESKELKSYKGYGIDKVWYAYDDDDKKVKGSDRYCVSDGEDYIGEEFRTLEEAKVWIDTL